MAGRDAQSRENILLAYTQLCELLRHEESLFWKRMETFLLISSGLIAIVGLIWPASSGRENPPLLLGIAISIVGMLICFGWLIVVARSEAFYNHWYEQLKYIEKEYLHPVDVFQKADLYFSKKPITIGDNESRLGGIASIAKIYSVMRAAPIMFSVLWLGFLDYTVIAWLFSLVGPHFFIGFLSQWWPR